MANARGSTGEDTVETMAEKGCSGLVEVTRFTVKSSGGESR